MKHLGDITKIKGSDVEIVDIITGGSPCQDLSVAGKRKGLAGERSGLFMEQIRIIKEMRDESKRNMGTDVDIRLLKPRFMVWENVQGAFSSNNGEDFRCVLEETAKVVQGDAIIPRPANGKWSHSGCIMGDGWSIAWRLHDAQFWGVPQRRKRISLVADFAGGGAPKILFERKSLPGDIEPCGTKGQGTSENVEGCVNPTSFTLKIRGGCDTDSNGRKAGKGALIQTELSGTLGVSQDQTLVCFEPGVASRVGGHIYENDKSGTIRANAGDNALAVAYGISSYDSNAMKSSNPHSGIYEANTSRTLDLNGGNPGCNQGGIAVVQGAEPTLCIDQGAGKSQCGITENVSPTLATTHGGEPVVYDASRRHDYEPFGDICETVQAHYGTGGGNIPMVVDKPQTYQEKCGSLCASGYDKLGLQEEMNDMYVTQPISCEVFHCETEEDKVKTLKARDYKDPQIVAYGVDAYNQTQSEEKTKALNSSATDSDHIPLVYGLDRASFNQGINAKYEFQVDEEKTQTLVAKGPNAICARDSKGIGNQYVDEGKCIVEPYQDSVGSLCARDSKGIDSGARRLTPMECERLQGFPDGWTDIGDWIDSKGKKHKGDSDSPRYKALGNSIALPFWQWMAERMVDILHTDGAEETTMASLFDGIGGFPLVYSRCGCKPIWASEIEEFPIAVTKVRFPSN